MAFCMWMGDSAHASLLRAKVTAVDRPNFVRIPLVVRRTERWDDWNHRWKQSLQVGMSQSLSMDFMYKTSHCYLLNTWQLEQLDRERCFLTRSMCSLQLDGRVEWLRVFIKTNIFGPFKNNKKNYDTMPTMPLSIQVNYVCYRVASSRSQVMLGDWPGAKGDIQFPCFNTFILALLWSFPDNQGSVCSGVGTERRGLHCSLSCAFVIHRFPNEGLIHPKVFAPHKGTHWRNTRAQGTTCTWICPREYLRIWSFIMISTFFESDFFKPSWVMKKNHSPRFELLQEQGVKRCLAKLNNFSPLEFLCGRSAHS